jgi:hypothetical protein
VREPREEGTCHIRKVPSDKVPAVINVKLAEIIGKPRSRGVPSIAWIFLFETAAST